MDIIYDNNQLEQQLRLLEELGEKEVAIITTKKRADLPQTTLLLQTAALVKNVKEAQVCARTHEIIIGRATRELIECKSVTHVYGAEELADKDKTHYRASGLNQVLAKLIVEKDKTYVFNIYALLTNSPERRVLLLGRMMFNNKILAKYKAKTLVASMTDKALGLRAPKEREQFLLG